jgi:hypothetical protein
MHKENHEDFRKRWNGSHEAVEMVAMMLLRSGFWVQILPQEMTPSFEARHNYSDSGDLKIFALDEELVCEVKGSSLEFKDGKHPFKSAFLCNQWSFDKADPKPSYYFIVDKSKENVAIFNVRKHASEMKLVTVTDKKRPKHETYSAYSVDSDLFSYRTL